MTFSTYYTPTGPLFKDMEILIIARLVIHTIGILIYISIVGSSLKSYAISLRKIMKNS